MFSQYGELRPISGWDRFTSLGHPSKFQWVSGLGFVTAPSLNGGQPHFVRCLAVSWAGTLYIYIFGGSCPLTEFYHAGAKFTFRPNIAFSYIFSVIARHSSSGRQPNFAAFSKGRHVYSSGRLSRWASVHILVLIFILHGIISNFYFWGLFHLGIGRHSLFNPSPPQFSRSNSLYWHSLK